MESMIFSHTLHIAAFMACLYLGYMYGKQKVNTNKHEGWKIASWTGHLFDGYFITAHHDNGSDIAITLLKDGKAHISKQLCQVEEK